MVKMMNKLYANFNSFRCNCPKCKYDLIGTIDLKKLADQISYDCEDLEEGSLRTLSYEFRCKKCNQIICKNISAFKQKSILIVE